jgi:hypothetical protein
MLPMPTQLPTPVEDPPMLVIFAVLLPAPSGGIERNSW